ncbi:MAG: fasciclin domain-containing protein [Brooklawnia sp.]|uniref:fasciclin domain-containing protein n=1 Tax=Brooklawnia sp. TaxID=2699740 RepID=UPI003C791B53
MKLKYAATGAAALALFLGACTSGNNTSESTTSPATTAPATSAPATTASPTMTSPSPTMDAATADIVDTAVAAGDFNTLATALTEAGLVETLKGPGPFTVFAPTDEAFAALPEGTLDELLADPSGQLTEVLTYHVIPGEVLAADVVELDDQSVETVQGGSLTIEVVDGGVVLVDETGARVNVTATDVMASNGVIHVIDGVLLPAAG